MKIVKWFILGKIFIQRSMTYYQAVSATLIVLTFLKTFNVPSVYYIPICAGAILLMIGWGWVERKTRIFAKEQELTTNEQPQVIEILNSVKRIEQQIKKLAKKA